MRLPADWYLSLDEIEGAVYDTFIKLLNNYEEGAMSPTSYCHQFGERYTFRDLMREYRKLKRQETLDVIYGEDKDDDEPCYHKYGIGDVPSLSVKDDDKLENRDSVSEIMGKANLIDKTIMNLVMEGKTLREIGEEVGLSKDAISKRLKKYHKVISEE